jgi:chromosome segregation ATPase
VATESSPLDPSLELLERLRDEASERVGRELDDLRAHLIKCCEHSIERLRDCGFVSLESVTPVVEALAGMAASERERANHLDNLLRATETELEELRAEHQTLTDSAREADTDCREMATRLERELDHAREAAAKAVDDSAAELVASRTRFQQVIDAQSLELVRLKRELDQANRGDRIAGRPALDAGRGPLTARERLAETLPFEAIDAALSATPPVAEWPKAV